MRAHPPLPPRYNPKNVRLRQVEKQEALQYLDKRAGAALGTQAAFVALQEKVTAKRSGIALGPISGSVTPQSVRLWAKAVTAGTVVFEVSITEDFSNVVESANVEVEAEGNLVAVATFDHLQSHNTYVPLPPPQPTRPLAPPSTPEAGLAVRVFTHRTRPTLTHARPLSGTTTGPA